VIFSISSSHSFLSFDDKLDLSCNFWKACCCCSNWANKVLWLALLGKLKTKDRLAYAQLDTCCIFCSQTDESHTHLFFACTWTCALRGKIKSWIRINRHMTSLYSDVRGLKASGKSLENIMRRLSLGLLVYLIWKERNGRIFEHKTTSANLLFRQFQIMFYTILYFHDKNPYAFNGCEWDGFVIGFGVVFFRQRCPIGWWSGLKWHAVCGCFSFHPGLVLTLHLFSSSFGWGSMLSYVPVHALCCAWCI
jgi:hypothetical protein